MKIIKRIVSLVIISALMLNVLGAVNLAFADGATVMNETFDTQTTGNAPDGFSKQTSTTSGVVIADKLGGKAGEKCIKVFSSAGATDKDIATTVKSFAEQKGTFSIEWDYYVEPTSSKNIYVKLTDGSTFPYAIGINMGKTELADYNGAIKIATGLKAGTWYHTKIVVNLDAKNYTAYLGNELKTTQPISFRNTEITKINNVNIANDIGAKEGVGYIDNIVVSTGASVATAPTVTTAPATATTTTSSASATAVVDENFDKTAAGSVPSGWKSTTTDTFSGGTVIAKPGVAAGDNCLKIFTDETATKSNPMVEKSFDTQAGTFTVSCDYFMSKTSAKNNYIKITENATFPYAVGIALGKDSVATWDSKPIAKGLEQDAWHNVKIVVDTVKQNYQVYVDNTLKTANPIPFRNTQLTKLNTIDLTNDTNEKVGLGYFDNIKIFTGAVLNNDNPGSVSTNPSETIKQRLSKAVVLYLGASNAIVNNNIQIIDPSNTNVKPIVKEGRTLVPVRFISESIGGKVDYDPATQGITITCGDKVVKMTIGSKTINVNGTDSTLEVPAQVDNGRTLIPLRAMTEAVGKKVFWDKRGLIIISDTDNIFNTTTEMGLIDKTIEMLTSAL